MNEKNAMKLETQRSWLERLIDLLLPEPQDKEELVELLRDAVQRQILDANALAMIEGVLQVSHMQVRDIMVPRSQVVHVTETNTLDECLPTVIQSGHSRFPVFNQDHDQVIGVLLAKDLLGIVAEENEKNRFNLREILRPVIFVPESKRVDVLLQDFRANRNHMAMVVDEYGSISGLVTIEDVLEQIVGDIADEYDIDEEAYIKKYSDTEYIVKAFTPIEEFNQYFGTKFTDEEYDTIGGLVIHHFGHLPKPGECVSIENYEFKVLHADNRRIRLLKATLLQNSENVCA